MTRLTPWLIVLFLATAVGAHRVEITYEAGERRILSATVDGIAVPVVQVHWFAWQAFYPETHLWKP